MKVSALSTWLNPCTSPASGASSSGVPPASLTACQGAVSSTCSTPSFAVRKATRVPLSSLAISESSSAVGCRRIPARRFHAPARTGRGIHAGIASIGEGYDIGLDRTPVSA